jgi:triacylglycerol lipase
MKLSGPSSGFVVEDVLYDVKTDLQGYVGYMKEYKNIYVVLRGSSSVMNWLDDFEIRLVDYKTFPECNCKVHNGFYKSALGVKNKTLATVKLLKTRFPTYKVVVTGHSYGASCGQLLGMELEREGINVDIYDFGQPRVGNKMYADFSNTIIKNYWRFVHNKDTVPHVPPSEGLGYLHSCREVFEDINGNLKTCSEVDCEDPTCANQYKFSQTNTEDHSYYLGHRVSCEASTTN